MIDRLVLQSYVIEFNDLECDVLKLVSLDHRRCHGIYHM